VLFLIDPLQPAPGNAPVLVCGLGALGQACLERLLEFGVSLRCLDLKTPNWRDRAMEDRLSGSLILGDMRQPRLLEQAQVRLCRAILLLSSDSTANFEAALQVRLLNPDAEIVVRSASSQASLGALLEQRLPGISVVDPILLCAGAISTSLQSTDRPVSLEVDGEFFCLREAPRHDHAFERPIRLPPEREGSLPLLLSPRALRASRQARRQQRAATLPRQWLGGLARHAGAAWRSRPPSQQFAALFLVGLTLAGVQAFASSGGWRQGLFVTLGLLKGEYVDPVNLLLGDAGPAEAGDGWLFLITLVYSLVGTLITSAIVAVILERLLLERLGRLRPRLGRRDPDPILLLEGDGLAREVARRLRQQGHAVVRVQSGTGETGEAEEPVHFDRLESALPALEGRSLPAIGVLSIDLLTNLRQALALQRRWPDARLAVLAHAFGASEQLGELLGGVAVISAVDLVADAVVATAFGERVEGVLRVRGINLLIVRYRIRRGDALCGLGIARVENGYGLTCVTVRRALHSSPVALPAADLLLAEGDQLVVLATPAALRSVEMGAIRPPQHRLRLRCPADLSADRRFEVQQSLARWIGCAPGEALALIDGSEQPLPPLDREIAESLRHDLRRQGVDCSPEVPPHR
jgi:Trk K+ transport system NAD-binding subunit